MLSFFFYMCHSEACLSCPKLEMTAKNSSQFIFFLINTLVPSLIANYFGAFFKNVWGSSKIKITVQFYNLHIG